MDSDATLVAGRSVIPCTAGGAATGAAGGAAGGTATGSRTSPVSSILSASTVGSEGGVGIVIGASGVSDQPGM